MGKFTPGPWITDHTRLRVTDSPDDTYALIIARVGEEWQEPNRMTAVANARLIAAAPELLASLNEMLLANELVEGATDEQLERCRAAIAKAEGKS